MQYGRHYKDDCCYDRIDCNGIGKDRKYQQAECKERKRTNEETTLTENNIQSNHQQRRPPTQMQMQPRQQKNVQENDKKHSSYNEQNHKTHNTFGWARIEILTILIVCITLTSLSFSLLVEALQTIVRVDHQDYIHLPIHIMILGLIGLLLNGVTHFLIGGCTAKPPQTPAFIMTEAERSAAVNSLSTTVQQTTDVTDNHSNLNNQSMTDLNEIKMQHNNNSNCRNNTKKDGKVTDNGIVVIKDNSVKPVMPACKNLQERYFTMYRAIDFLRDISSTMFVIVCAIIVHFAEDKDHTAVLIDPVLSIFSCVLVVTLSYPYSKYNALFRKCNPKILQLTNLDVL